MINLGTEKEYILNNVCDFVMEERSGTEWYIKNEITLRKRNE